MYTTPRPKQIIAIGGGWLGADPALDDFILSKAQRDRPRVCFLPTASGDSDSYIVSFYEAFPASKCEPSHLILLRGDLGRISERILEQDIILVGGGNTANMLALWRLHGVDAALREAYENGVVLAGSSAGANCWFECSISDSFGDLQALQDGLGLLKGSVCPHYDSEEERRPAFHGAIRNGLSAGLALDDATAAVFTDGVLEEAVTSRVGPAAYSVSLENGDVVEKKLEVRLLTG